MKVKIIHPLLTAGLSLAVFSCTESVSNDSDGSQSSQEKSIITANFGSNIDLENLKNYAGQTKPTYITRDNTSNNPITNSGATLGRVLFYDKNLSVNNTKSCASCHKQEFAFSDTALVSSGVNGTTGRHSMRLINSRFSDEAKFFWDERAATLEAQTTRPIQDHAEMGFSGADGDPSISDLIVKLNGINYYPILFKTAFGNSEITEEKIQKALAQFVRSIQSFDSKFDAGRSNANSDVQNFSNFTTDENAGKNLFISPPPQGGAGCAGCHNPPEFSIDPISLNNGIIAKVGNEDIYDFTNTKSPSLRDVVRSDGTANGPMMHDGSKKSLLDVINHYNAVPQSSVNAQLDPKLLPLGNPQRLNLTSNQKNQLIAFMKTLAGQSVYTDGKWSDPFLKR